MPSCHHSLSSFLVRICRLRSAMMRTTPPVEKGIPPAGSPHTIILWIQSQGIRVPEKRCLLCVFWNTARDPEMIARYGIAVQTTVAKKKRERPVAPKAGWRGRRHGKRYPRKFHIGPRTVPSPGRRTARVNSTRQVTALHPDAHRANFQSAELWDASRDHIQSLFYTYAPDDDAKCQSSATRYQLSLASLPCCLLALGRRVQRFTKSRMGKRRAEGFFL